MLVLDDWPRTRFARLLTIKGTEPLVRPELLDQFVAAECSPYPEEAKALVAARDQDIPLRILRGIATKGEDEVVDELAEDLHFRAALQPEAARWAVAAWLAALREVPTDSLNAWLADVDPAVPRVPFGWGTTIALESSITSDSTTAPPARPAAAVDFGDPNEPRAEPNDAHDAARSPEDWLQIALRIARADGDLSLGELDELVALAKEHGVPDAEIKHLVERITLKGTLHDQLAGIVWYILPPSRRAGLHFGPAIPPTVRGAAEALCHIPKDEEVLAVLACEGDPVRIAFGTRGVYWHNAPDATQPGAFSIGYGKLAKTPLQLGAGDSVDVGGNLTIHIGHDGIRPGELLLMLQALKGLMAWRAATRR